MLEFGQVYRKLRIAKGIKVKDATFNICTPQNLNRFEKGETNISLDVFQKLLSRLFISWSEFMFHVQSGFIDEYLVVSKAIELAFLRQNIPQLHHLSNKYLTLSKENKELSIFYKLLSIVIRSKIYELNPNFRLNEEEIIFVKKHLDRIETWGNFELFLITNLVQELPIDYLKHTYICNNNISKRVKLSLSYSQNTELILNNSLSFINRLLNLIMFNNNNVPSTIELIEIISADANYFFNIKENRQQYPIQYIQFCFIKGLISLTKNDKSGCNLCKKSLENLVILEHYSVITNQMYKQFQYFNKF